jgi:hypothetical protein
LSLGWMSSMTARGRSGFLVLTALSTIYLHRADLNFGHQGAPEQLAGHRPNFQFRGATYPPLAGGRCADDD